MATKVTWHGTHEECLALITAVSRNCTCQFSDAGVRVSVCEPHAIVSRDQRALDGLLFARRMAERLLAEEFLMTPKPALEA